jgi:hypothetical protein
MYQLPLRLQERASVRIERLIPETCPHHPGTTLDGRPCEVCAIPARTSPWVAKAAESSLPYKSFR